MSVTGIVSNLFNLSPQTVQDRFKEFQQDLQQLGNDLQAGNLSAAQTDFASLQKLQPSNADGAASPSTSLGQSFQQLSNDLKTGDLQDAQKTYSDLMQQLQSRHAHHAHRGQQISQEMSQLQQALQSGDLSAAQQAYNALQSIRPFDLNTGASGSASTSAAGVSVQA
jgi:hypothetical protein